MMWRRAATRAVQPRALSWRRASVFVPGVPKKLDDVLKLDLVRDKPPQDIAHLWTAYHDDDAELAAATLQDDEYTQLAERAAESPAFFFPLRRGTGHISLYSQYNPTLNMFGITSLEAWQRSPELAPPWMSVHFFGELLVTKRLGLLRAEASSDHLTRAEVDTLLRLVLTFYGSDKYDRVWVMNHMPQRFNVDQYVQLALSEQLSEDAAKAAAEPPGSPQPCDAKTK